MKKRIFLILLIGLPVLAASWAWLRPRDAQFYYDRGEERLQPTDEDGNGADFEGALADFNRAIKLDPTFAAAYRMRAGLEEGDITLADYSRAIALEPTNKLNYINRASFWENNANLHRALADLNQAIEANPQDEELFRRRAQLKHKLGDYSGMVADLAREGEVFPPAPTNGPKINWQSLSPHASDPARIAHRLLGMYDRAIQQNPDFYWGYFNRGALKHLADDPDGALEDFRRCSTFSDRRLRDCAAIHIWLVQTQRGETNAASAELLDHFSDRIHQPAPDWEVQIARFLVGQMSEAELLAAVGKDRADWEQSEVWYYSAMKHLLAGDKVEAGECFQKSRMTQTRPYVVAISSQIELERLGN